MKYKNIVQALKHPSADVVTENGHNTIPHTSNEVSAHSRHSLVLGRT